VSETRTQRKALEREIHVWLTRPADIADPTLQDRCCAILCEDELARMQRFRTDALKQLFLVSHALVRSSLSRYEDVAPEAWRFSAGPHGRPEIAHPITRPALRFNLSHTAGLAACVVCLEWDCGVDVERVGRVNNLEGVARRVFCERERDDLDSLPSDDARHGRFTDYWTLKEAYIKARGLGFQLAPRRFGVSLGGSGVEIAFGPDMADQRAADWQLELQPVGEGMRLGVALRRRTAAARRVLVRETVPCADA
jgi:4'-phosphopantetheinyl transferase